LKHSLVQILVVVANIQERNLKADVEKGFKRTLLELELVDPNAEINLVENVMVNGYCCCCMVSRLYNDDDSVVNLNITFDL